MVDIVLTDAIISITDLKKNPMQVQELFPAVCVLNRNKPAFYCISPERYEELLEIESDVRLNESIGELKAGKTIRVEIDEDGDLHPVAKLNV